MSKKKVLSAEEAAKKLTSNLFEYWRENIDMTFGDMVMHVLKQSGHTSYKDLRSLPTVKWLDAVEVVKKMESDEDDDDEKPIIVVFDLETTGLDPDKDRIVQIAAVKLDMDLCRIGGTLNYVVNPQYPISESATSVHGFDQSMVENNPTFESIAEEVLEFFKCDYIAGFNSIAYDLPVLRAEFERVGIDFDPMSYDFLDALEVFRYYRPHTLSGALREYCGENHELAHDAMADVEATVKVLRAQSVRHDIDLDEIETISRKNRVTLDGKLVLNEENEIVLAFGKNQGSKLHDLVNTPEGENYLQWILKESFPEETKKYIRQAFLDRDKK